MITLPSSPPSVTKSGFKYLHFPRPSRPEHVRSVQHAAQLLAHGPCHIIHGTTRTAPPSIAASQGLGKPERTGFTRVISVVEHLLSSLSIVDEKQKEKKMRTRINTSTSTTISPTTERTLAIFSLPSRNSLGAITVDTVRPGEIALNVPDLRPNIHQTTAP